jgi:glutathione peroxidase-family protein
MNFSKFLINKDGDVVGFYNPQRSPSTMKDDIEMLLGMV